MIFGVTLTAVMGVSSITPAFPQMAQALHVSTEQIGLLITAYTVPGIFLTPFLGIIADRFGRKRILIPSLLLFGIAGSACFLARSFVWLLILRFFQGIGGASLGSMNVTLIGDLYDGKRRATAMGYNSSVLSVGTASYPAVGGAMAVFGWYYPFLLPIIAIPIGALVLWKLKNPTPDKDLDLGNYITNLIGTLKSWTVVGLFSVNFLTFIMLYGAMLTYFPVLLDQRFGKSSLVIGLMLAAASVVTAISSSQLGRLSAYIHERRLILTASLLYLSTFLLLSFIHSFWLLIIPVLLFGLGQGLNIPSTLNLLTYQAPMKYRAAFLSVNWTVIRGGQALGPLIIGLAYSYFGLLGAFLTGAGAAILMVIVVALLVLG